MADPQSQFPSKDMARATWPPHIFTGAPRGHLSSTLFKPLSAGPGTEDGGLRQTGGQCEEGPLAGCAIHLGESHSPSSGPLFLFLLLNLVLREADLYLCRLEAESPRSPWLKRNSGLAPASKQSHLCAFSGSLEAACTPLFMVCSMINIDYHLDRT